MNKLWAPWRSSYIYGLGKAKKRCFLCIPKKANKKRDKTLRILHRSKFCFSILNKYPYNNGHLMIVPYKHVSSLELLSEEALLDMMRLLNKTKMILDDSINPQGYNIGINLGKVAGAGVQGHVHIHIVPRWNGDTNFMPVLGNTKVISESMDALYRRLKGVAC